jgi:hypothetical protein
MFLARSLSQTAWQQVTLKAEVDEQTPLGFVLGQLLVQIGHLVLVKITFGETDQQFRKAVLFPRFQ